MWFPNRSDTNRPVQAQERARSLCNVSVYIVMYAKRNAHTIRGMFFNSCHLLDYFSRGLTARKLFVCGESPIFSDQIGIKIVAL